VLTSAERGRRNRRTIDAVVLALAAGIAGLTAVIARSSQSTDERVADALTTVLGWLGPLWRMALVALLILALALVVDVILRRRWDLLRDVAIAVLGVACVGAVLGRAVEADWSPVEAHVFSRWGYPELRVATATAIVVVLAPELLRWVRRLATWLVPLAAVGTIVIGAALPSAALAALAVGAGVGAIVRLAFGSAAGVPPAEEVRRAMEALGIAVAGLATAEEQHIGSAEYVGHDSTGAPLRARVLGRDAQDTQRLARHWRLLAYKDPPPSAPIGRLEQVEHEGLATLLAAQAGVRVPELLAAALTEDGDALVVTRRPEVAPLELAEGDGVDDAALRELWEQVARLHEAGISHGRLNAGNVILLEDGPMLLDFAAATLGAPQSALDVDVAELLVATTLVVGPARALAAATEGLGAGAVAASLPYLQRAALTPHVRDLARTHEVALKDLRVAAAHATGADEPPELVPLRRVRPRDLVVTALVFVAAYLLITQLAEIGFGTIADELRTADAAWVALALVVAQLTFVAQGISLRGAVAAPLPLLPCVVLQAAIKFINLTVPSSAGRIAINVRFLQRLGVPTEQAVLSGAIDGVAETVIQVLIVFATLPFARAAIDTGRLELSAPDGRLVAAIALALVGVVAVVLSVPRLRDKVVPTVKSALASLWVVARTRRKRLELFGGNVAAAVLFALTLGAVCRAYGVDLSFAELLLINTAASAFAGLMPVPGGIGAAEAALTAGLAAVGVDESVAFAIAFTHRLCTYYLPPVWGYVALRWLGRKGYV
jgi:uncharacterized membrane protein YbhN (UPF0104 family)